MPGILSCRTLKLICNIHRSPPFHNGTSGSEPPFVRTVRVRELAENSESAEVEGRRLKSSKAERNFRILVMARAANSVFGRSHSVLRLMRASKVFALMRKKIESALTVFGGGVAPDLPESSTVEFSGQPLRTVEGQRSIEPQLSPVDQKVL